MRLYDQIEKQKQIKKEMAKIRKLFQGLSKDRQRAIEGLVQEAAWMRITLEETRYIVDRDGPVEFFEQGAQRMLREHPAAKTYNAMINRYSAVCKQLFDLIPSQDNKQAADELMAFVKQAKA